MLLRPSGAMKGCAGGAVPGNPPRSQGAPTKGGNGPVEGMGRAGVPGAAEGGAGSPMGAGAGAASVGSNRTTPPVMGVAAVKAETRPSKFAYSAPSGPTVTVEVESSVSGAVNRTAPVSRSSTTSSCVAVSGRETPRMRVSPAVKRLSVPMMASRVTVSTLVQAASSGRSVAQISVSR